VDDHELERLRTRVLEAARTSDRRRRRRHRVVAVVTAGALAVLVTGGAVALAAPPPPPPLTSDEEYASYQRGIEAAWAELQARYPDATRPDAEFERFVTADEEGEVVGACLREQGILVEIDEHGWTVTVSPDEERSLGLALFVCSVRFPLSPNEHLPYTEAELRHIYRYFAEQLIPCLEARGYDLPAAPDYAEFRSRWWTDETWGPYADLRETDAERFLAAEEACPPMPSDLRR
jgi:hypothetical protein